MESALSSWDEVGSTVLPQLIDEMELHLTDASQLSSMQARVVSALAQGSKLQSAAREVLEQWVLDGEIQGALELLNTSLVYDAEQVQLRTLQPIVTRNVRQGKMSTEESVSAALALW